jgi:hypothetical protein
MHHLYDVQSAVGIIHIDSELEEEAVVAAAPDGSRGTFFGSTPRTTASACQLH